MRKGRDPIRHALVMIVKDFRDAGVHENDLIRAEILAAAKQALDAEDAVVPCAAAEDGNVMLADAAGIFRWIFKAIGVDHRDQRIQETLYGRIERALAEVLADH